MKKSRALALTFLGVWLLAAAAPSYKLSTKIKLAGDVRWDDLFVDSANHRAYISHNSQVEVFDTATDKPVGVIANTPAVHGIAIANDLGKGFVTAGTPGGLVVFDLATLKETGKIATGMAPDSVSYDVSTQRVITFNVRGNDATLVDAKTGDVVKASIPLASKPAYSQTDGKGHVWVNVEDANEKQEIVEVSTKDGTVIRRWALAPCEDASGLAIDVAKMRLYTACGNKMVAISDATAGKVIGTATIGAGPDSIAFDDGYAFTPDGQDSTISVVSETAPGKFERVATIPMSLRARIIGADQKLHKLYVPAADYGAAPAGGGRGRAPALPDTFRIEIYSR